MALDKDSSAFSVSSRVLSLWPSVLYCDRWEPPFLRTTSVFTHEGGYKSASAASPELRRPICRFLVTGVQ